MTTPDIRTRSIAGLPALERELASGLAGEWRRAVDDDPLASLFQSPSWCVPWYRCYADEYEPRVLVVERGAEVVGIVPLALQLRTGELAFASNRMADYRDVVARPGHRHDVVAALIDYYRQERFSGQLEVGWIDPSSDTLGLVADVCKARGLRYTLHPQPCWRWFPVDGENLNKRFSRLRTHLNALKREGPVNFEVISKAPDWTAFSREFFRQHSLRQLQAGRPLSFHDPRKRRHYDQLFGSADSAMHVTALRVGDRLTAGHIGFAWRGVLMFGAPSISIEHEQRSPSLILLSWIIQNARELGLAGFDMTIGDGEYKKRLGNQCVDLALVHVYSSAQAYYGA